jgi:hypothetical protein
MNKKGHWIFGAVLCLFFILLAGFFNMNWFEWSVSSVLIIIGLIAFYSILPDIDHKAGTMTWVFLGIGIMGLVIGLIILIFDFHFSLAVLISSTLLLTATFLAAHWMPHRGFIHTIWVGILSVIPLYFLFHSLAYCFLGYLAWHSHLIADGYIFKIR